MLNKEALKFSVLTKRRNKDCKQKQKQTNKKKQAKNGNKA